MEVEDRLTITLGFVTVLLFTVTLGYVIQQLFVPPTGKLDYQVIFREPVSGLEKNARVTLQGITVGRVQEIRLVQGEALVKIAFDPDQEEKVRRHVLMDGPPVIRAASKELADRIEPKDRVLRMARSGEKGEKEAEPKTVNEVEEFLRRVGQDAKDRPELEFHLVLKRKGREATSRFKGTEDLDLEFSNVGARAILQTSLVTGIQWIELSPGTSDLAVLKTPPESWTVPTTTTGFSRLVGFFERKAPQVVQKVEDFMVQANDAGKHVNSILVDVKAMLGDQGKVGQVLTSGKDLLDRTRHHVGKDSRTDALLKSSSELAEKLNRQLADGGDLQKALASLQKTLESSERWMAADGLLKSQLEKVQEKLKAVTDRTNELLANADKLVKETHEQLLGDARLRRGVEGLNYVIQRDLRQALVQLTDTLAVLKQTLIQMQSNPDSFLLGKRSSKTR